MERSAFPSGFPSCVHTQIHLTYAFSKVFADWSFTPHSHDVLLVFPVLGSQRDSLRFSGQSESLRFQGETLPQKSRWPALEEHPRLISDLHMQAHTCIYIYTNVHTYRINPYGWCVERKREPVQVGVSVPETKTREDTQFEMHQGAGSAGICWSRTREREMEESKASLG